LVAACTDAGEVLDPETAARLLDAPGQAEAFDGVPVAPALAAAADAANKARMAEVERRHASWFDAEAARLDRWAEDLKVGLEREIKELDRAIKDAQKLVRLATTMADKLGPLRQVRDCTADRDQKRRRLYEAQDEIDARRDGLIGEVEKSLERFVRTERVFEVRWRVLAG